MKTLLSNSSLDLISGGDTTSNAEAAVAAWESANQANMMNPVNDLIDAHFVGLWNGTTFPTISGPPAEGIATLVGQIANDPNLQISATYVNGEAANWFADWQSDPNEVGGVIFDRGMTLYGDELHNGTIVDADPLGQLAEQSWENEYLIYYK